VPGLNSDFDFCPRCAGPLSTQDLAGLPRRACSSPDCGYVHWDNPVPVVAALVEYRGLIVLARNHAWPEKMFGLITGFLERDETPEQGVAREVKEEIDLDVASVRLIGVYPFTRKNELILAYHVVAAGEIVLNEELAEFRLIAPEKLRPWEFGTGLAVADWLDRRKG
jgi:NAD+ diphosphatase